MIQQSTLWAIRTGNYPQIAFRKSSMISKWQESFAIAGFGPLVEMQTGFTPFAGDSRLISRMAGGKLSQIYEEVLYRKFCKKGKIMVYLGRNGNEKTG